MKTTAKFSAVVSLLVLGIAGCAHRTHYSNYQETYPAYASPNTRTYENPGMTYNSYNSSTYSPGYNSSSSTVNQYSPSTTSQSSTSVIASGGDQVLITQIRQSLNNNPNLVEIVPNIQVTAQNGTVILNGTVPNEQQKQAVETLVKSTAGVVNVNNQLQVNLSPTASKSSDKSSRTYTGETTSSGAAADVSGALSTESKGSANDSSATSSGSSSFSSSALTTTNRSNPSTPNQGLPPTSDRPEQEPRLYSTNDTGILSNPQSSISRDRSAAVTAGIEAGQGRTIQQVGTTPSGFTQSATGQSGISATQNETAQSPSNSDNLSSEEHKDLSISADSGQKTTIYSNGPSALLTNNSSRSSLYTSTGDASTSAWNTNTASQPESNDKELSATGNSQPRRYSGTNTNSSTTTSAATVTNPQSFEVNVQGVSQADQAIGQTVISELRADTSLTALMPTIRVKIENGKATLSGTVRSQEEKLKMEAAVQKVTGITSVDDQLRVGGAPAPAPLK